jgi:hypothetical protein
MFRKFHRGELNLSRLNYGLTSLIPKTEEANNIKQYRPICLLGVDYKWFTPRRLTRVVESVIRKSETAFYPRKEYFRGGGDPS